MINKIFNHKISVPTTYKLIALLAMIYFWVNTRVIATAMPLSLLGYKIISWFNLDFSIFSIFPNSLQQQIQQPILTNPTLVLIIGYMLGVWMVTLRKGPYKLTNTLSKKSVIKVMVGGILVGFGVQGIYGANIGEVYGAISMLSLSGWIMVAGSLVGLWLGKPLYKWFNKD